MPMFYMIAEFRSMLMFYMIVEFRPTMRLHGGH